VGCSVLQWVAVCCSVLQCVAVCCSVLQCVAVCRSCVYRRVVQCAAVCRSVLQCVAACVVVFDSIWQHSAVCCSECCSVLQCVAACRSVLQRVAVGQDLQIRVTEPPSTIHLGEIMPLHNLDHKLTARIIGMRCHDALCTISQKSALHS